MPHNSQTYSFYCLLIFFAIAIHPAHAQIGGGSTYQFLDLIPSARVGALGGILLSVQDSDVSLTSQNPSLLNKAMDNQLSLNVTNYFAGINYGDAMVAKHYKHLGTCSAGMMYIRYGDFPEAYSNGDLSGRTFSAGEYALNLGWGISSSLNQFFSTDLEHPLFKEASLSGGINLKSIYSVFDTYYSFGLVADGGVTFNNTAYQLTSALVVKNIGRQIKPYYAGNIEPMPFEIQWGISKKLEKAPVRISLTARHLEKFDLTYIDSAAAAIDPVTNQPIIPNISFAEKLLRHFIVGAELFLSKNFFIDAGYNYERRRELEVDTRTSTVGTSWGFGFRINKFQLSYARAAYNLAGAANHFTITTNLSDFHYHRTNYQIEPD